MGATVDKGMPRIEIGFGIFLIALGAFILAAVSNPLEIAVWAGGPLMALVGLGLAIAALLRRSGFGLIAFGFTAFVLGSLLGIHDFLFPPAIAVFIHLGIAVATLVLGILQLARKKGYYGSWFKRGTMRSA